VNATRKAAFERYASWVSGKPTWESEERTPRLTAAAGLREAVGRAAGGGDWRAALLDCLLAPWYRRADLTLSGQDRWFRQWLDSADTGLESAVAAFGRSATGPEERFAAFADAAAAAVEAGRVPDDPPAVMAFGSLLNFAVDPERLPFVLRRPFSGLEELLSEPTGQDGSLAAEYGHHLRFAGTVEDALRPGGVAADMLDVQALVFSAARNTAFWSTPAGVGPDVPVVPRGAPHYLAVCAIYRDEASYMREWVDFHRLVGVERFYLYDNNSVDDHREVLAPYLERGEVTIQDWPVEMGQRPAYEHCVQEHTADTRWIAFIDLDEFLFSPTGRPLPDLLREYERWPAVGVNWAVFGPSGHLRRPPGLVTESYTKRLQTGENRSLKTIADPARVCRVTGIHRFEYDSLDMVDENGYPITGAVTKSESRARLQLNHYVTKSFEEAEIRSRRSRPNRGQYSPQAWRRPFDAEDLRQRDAAAVPDEAILRYVPALKEAVGRRR
jgi:hypothetical protein